MITGELKNKVDAIWQTFWDNGISNPLSVIEQFTYLVFLRQLDERQIKQEKMANLTGKAIEHPIYPEKYSKFRWSHLKNVDPEQMFDLMTKPDRDLNELTAFEYMKQIGEEGGVFAKYMKNATFLFQADKANVLDKVVQQIDKLPLDNKDATGDIYEYMVSKLQTGKRTGGFRTPRHIIDLMVHLADIKPNDLIADPACGTAGFLVAANEFIYNRHYDWFDQETFRNHYPNMFHGMEIDPTMVRIAAMNLQLHGVEQPNLQGGDSLSEREKDIDEAYSLILANPPFKGSLDYDQVESSLLQVTKTKKTELLFLSLMLRQLKKGGRALVIVPDGVLFGSSGAHKNLRKSLVEDHQLQGIVSLPSGVFKPYAGVSTAILLFTKTGQGGTDQVWFYDMQADGYSLNDQRNALITDDELKESFASPERMAKQLAGKCDIADVLMNWQKLNSFEPDLADFSDRKKQSFLVPKGEIADNDYDLSINRYKEIVYEEIEYDAPDQILNQITELDRQRDELLAALKQVLQ